MQKITTFLTFNHQAEEAMNLYMSVFKNSKVLSRMPGPNGSIMSASFELEGQEFIVLNGGPQFTFSMGTSLFVKCDTQEEIDELYEKLSDGGVKQPCGWLQDKFGVSWQIIPPILGELLQDKDREKAQRVLQAMLKMHKIDIKALKEA